MDAAQASFVERTEAEFASREPVENPEVTAERLREAAMPIIARLTGLANDAVRERQPIEQRWIEDMCQFAGVRSVQELKGPTKDKMLAGGSNDGKATQSQVFVNITRAKTNRTEGRLFDILFPADDRNWGISPTPVPELAIVAKAAMEAAEAALDEANRLRQSPEAVSPTGMTEEDMVQQATDLAPQAAEAVRKLDEAKKRCERMEAEIDDQLTEGLYPQKARDAISWACKIGVGIIKGPVLQSAGRRRWEKAESPAEPGKPPKPASFQLADGNDRPSPKEISPWSFFPDPSATSMADAEYVLERHLPSKRELQKMARALNFDKQVVRKLLKNGPGESSPLDTEYLSNIRLLTGETTQVKGRYIVWEFHGQLTVEEVASLLRAPGTPEAEERAKAYVDGADPLDERMVMLYFCDNDLLKITEYYPMDSDDFVYSVFCLEKGQASILGAVGVPRIMRDSQMALNAAWRMMMDNAALSVAPQILIDQAKVKPAPGDDWQMRPRKSWMWDSSNGTSQQPPFQVFNIPMNQDQIAGIIALAKAFIDDETAMPSIIEGGNNSEQAPGAASTVGGFAMLLNSAGVNIRRMVKNWDDDITSGLVRRFYDYNMQHSEKEEIKGDMAVEARGTSVLLAREMEAQNLAAMALNWTVHPILGGMMKSYDMARKALQAMSINPDDVLLSREEFEAWQKAQADMAGEQGPEDPQWAIRLQIAEMESQARLQIAEMDRETEMMRLSASTQVSLAEIQATLQGVREKNQSSERALAVETAVEAENARKAEAMGMQPTGSGGAISMGAEKI